MAHQPSASSFFVVYKSRSFRGFANTPLLLYSRIKRDFRPPKIGNRTGRYFTPWNGPNLHCARNPGTKAGFSSSLLRQKIVLSPLPFLLFGTREFSGSNEHRILPARPNRRYFSCRPYFVFVTRRLTDGNLKRI